MRYSYEFKRNCAERYRLNGWKHHLELNQKFQNHGLQRNKADSSSAE